MKKRPEVVEMRRVVDAFADEMYRELIANQRKGNRQGWLSCQPMQLVLEVFHHAAKLHSQVRLLDDGEWDRDTDQMSPTEREMHEKTLKDIRELIREFAADVANMAMMVADISGVLDVPQGEPDGEERPNTRWTKDALEHKRG